MSETVSEFLLSRLHSWGVDRIFGFAGDGINGILGALSENQDKIRFIPTRHEELAAFMACAHAKFTGRVGVCLATSGPGAIHLLNGLYDAKKDNMPVLAIVGQQARMALGGDYQQEVDLISLFKDVAGDYVHMASTASQVRTLVDQSMRIAFAERTVTTIILPNDLQTEPMETASRTHGSVFSGIGYARPYIIPRDEELERAAEILNKGERVAMLVGAGALSASAEVRQVAERLDAGVAKALLGKAVLADEIPYVTGSIGLLGTAPSWELMMNCDTLLLVGTNFPYSEFLPPEGQAKAVQIDVKSRRLGLRYPTDVNLHGDTKDTLNALLPMLEKKADQSWRNRIEDSVKTWWNVVEKRAKTPADPVNPQRVFWELSPLLPSDAIITCDSGSSANWFARDLKVGEGMMASLSGGLATMGPGVPYAIAGKFAYPERTVVATLGDGAMQMNGLNGLITIAHYWKEWSNPRLILLVLNNEDLNQVTWEQRAMEGDARFDTSQKVPAFNYARYAENLGLKGLRIEKEADIVPTWKEAFKSDRPVVVDAVVDPSVPPLPPHIKVEQAMKYAQAMVKGDSQAWDTVVQSFQHSMASFAEKARSLVSSSKA